MESAKSLSCFSTRSPQKLRPNVLFHVGSIPAVFAESTSSPVAMFIYRLLPIVENQLILPDHQFGFRQRHSIIQQAHRLVNKIHEAIKTKQYCSAAFLDISQALDKVRHTGLLYKLRQSLPLNYFLLLKSYLNYRPSQSWQRIFSPTSSSRRSPPR
jgi:hypothetical protein